MQPRYLPSRIFIFLWLCVLLGIAVFIRIDGAERYDYHVDEVMHVDIAKGDTIGEVLRYSLYETHPPLGHIVRHYWLQLSDAFWFQRILSLLFGLATILLYYRIGAFIRTPFTGMCLAVFAAFSSGLVIQSYVIRNYSPSRQKNSLI